MGEVTKPMKRIKQDRITFDYIIKDRLVYKSIEQYKQEFKCIAQYLQIENKQI